MLKHKPSMMRFTGLIQKKVQSQDSNGFKSTVWTDLHPNVPMSVLPLSGKEYVASNRLDAEVIARIEMYKLTPFDASMRIVVNGMNYDITAILPDFTNNVYVNCMVREGVSDG